ncbi:uncharacterized protein METZ01_LOCUS350862 [marine metagenome]|uniref:Uncharacterized protein n=1 Tax=marine metagenome TaxID=408172 RepID=A0A382RLZ3_9ZZZZ
MAPFGCHTFDSSRPITDSETAALPHYGNHDRMPKQVLQLELHKANRTYSSPNLHRDIQFSQSLTMD